MQRGGLTADGTIILTDLPIDLRPNEEVLLEAGEIFGEMSALSRYPISADVVARYRSRVPPDSHVRHCG